MEVAPERMTMSEPKTGELHVENPVEATRNDVDTDVELDAISKPTAGSGLDAIHEVGVSYPLNQYTISGADVRSDRTWLLDTKSIERL